MEKTHVASPLRCTLAKGREREREGNVRDKRDRTTVQEGKGNGTKKRWRSLGSPFNVICNTGWPNDATDRDRTGIRVEACEHGEDSPRVSSRVAYQGKRVYRAGIQKEEVVIYIHVSRSLGC